MLINFRCKRLTDKNTFIYNKDDYKQWKKNVLPELETNTLHVIASHGGYIRKDVLGELGNYKIKKGTGKNLTELFDNNGKVRNLGAFLFKYDEQSNPEIIAAYPKIIYGKLKDTPEIPESLKKYIRL